MVKKLSKISLLVGFISAFIGYSFWELMWESAFYQFIAFAFVCYTFAIFNECVFQLWRSISFVVFVSSVNAFTDELSGVGFVFNWSEYVSILVITIFFVCRKKILTTFNVKK